VNPYELLELKLDCTEQEIRTAYRQTSRKVHPDRVSFFLVVPST
jgi:DnaJ family protein C protein 17